MAKCQNFIHSKSKYCCVCVCVCFNATRKRIFFTAACVPVCVVYVVVQKKKVFC